jgi:hypothetical protein
VIRSISHTECQALLTCQAQHDFRYGDVLASSSLRPKDTPVLLREGRAWGRAVAAFPAAGSEARDYAIRVLVDALEEDAEQQRDAGFYDADEHRETAAKLRAMLEHYAEESDPLPIDRLEHELLVPLPSRSGKGDSSRYRLQVFFDGIHVDHQGRTWLVEFKLRRKFSPYALIANSRQIRYYAWAYQREMGQPVTGVIVDERLNEVPKPARILKSGQPSHAKDQLTTPELYIAACEKADVEPLQETLAALEARPWQQRTSPPIFLSQEEIAEAGRELVSLGEQVRDADAGRYPVRNVRPQNCNGCAFKEICNNPQETEMVDALFERVPAKRDRQESPA